MYGVWFCLNLFESTMAAVLRPDPKNQIPSRDEREKAEWNGSNPCWSLLVVLFRCLPSRFQPFRLEKIPALQDVASSLKVDGEGCLLTGIGTVPLDISGPFWAQGGSRCAETTSAPVTNEFEETLRRSGAPRVVLVLGGFSVFVFLVDQQVAEDVATPKIYGA